MAVTVNDVRLYYTISTGPGSDNPQPDPSDSFGGYASHTPFIGGQINNLFGASPAEGSLPEYRCLYVVNQSDTYTWNNVRVFIPTTDANGPKFYIGIDPTAVSELTTETQQTIRPSSSKISPSGVTFSAPNNYTTGINVGTLPPGHGRGVWIKREFGDLPTSSTTTTTISVAGYQ